MSQPAQQQPITIGPSRLRLHLGDWAQVENAAAEGLLDEHTYVELKSALPPAGKNLETSRDLASFGVLGGVLVIGIKDAGAGRAGEVVGVDDAQATRDRLVAIADGGVQPPLPCEVLVIEQPSQPGRGCVVCIIQPSSQAPHRADDRYWGRSSTGKRVLDDPEVASLFAERRNLADRFREELVALAERSFDPIPLDNRAGGHLYLAAKPKHAPLSSPPWTQTDSIFSIVGGALQHGGTGWPDFSGARYSVGHPFGVLAQSFPAGEQPGEEEGLVKILIKDDGSLHAVSGLGTFKIETRDGQAQQVVLVPAVAVQVDQFVRATGLVAERMGVWGSWTMGVRITDLLDTQSHGERNRFRMGGTTSRYPEPELLMITDATTAEIRNRPQDVVQRLLQPLARGFSETRLFPYNNPQELFRH